MQSILWFINVTHFVSYIDYYDNTTEVTNQPVMSQHSEDTTTPVYAYYIIGIGSAVLLIALTLAICCCAYTCYVRWINAKELPPMPVSMKDPWGLYSVSCYYCCSFLKMCTV